MEYINIHTRTLGSEAFLDAEPVDQSTWLLLLSFCCNQENGGRIVGCGTWLDQKWIRMTGGVTVERAARACPLWRWDGADILVTHYPLEQEAKLQAQRNGGKIGGQKSGEARRREPLKLEAPPEAHLEGKLQTTLEAPPEAHLEQKEKKGKEKERKEREDLALFSEIPSEAEVRTWAGMSGVDPDYAAAKWADTNEKSAWLYQGRLIDWKARWLRFWNSDREAFQKKRRAAAPAAALPPEAKPGDSAWWWQDDLTAVEAALSGAALGDDKKTAARLREILKIRKASKRSEKN